MLSLSTYVKNKDPFSEEGLAFIFGLCPIFRFSNYYFA